MQAPSDVVGRASEGRLFELSRSPGKTWSEDARSFSSLISSSSKLIPLFVNPHLMERPDLHQREAGA
jgi:hypothetical protein